MYQDQMSFEEKLTGQRSMSVRQAAVIKQTYLLLSLSVISAVAGSLLALSSPAIRNFFSSPIGWIAAMIALNVIPMVAMAMRHNGVLGVAALLFDGFFAGLVLGPLVFMAERIAPGLATTAMMVTGIVFLSVTGYVLTSKRTFSAPRGLMTGIFFSIIGVVVLNMFLQMTMIGLLISVGIGIFGVFVLVYATSEVLNNPEADSPIPGALMLFAGLFNVFQAVLHVLMAVTRR